jgi:hypothetical protein
MPPRSTLVYTAMRPIRALTMVACPDGLDWRVPFIAALRAQVLIWGGQSNLLVPADADVLANPLLWAMHKTLDPEAVLLHPGSWGDIKDLVPARFDAHESDLRGQLESQGSTEPAIDDFLQRVPAEPWSEGLDADDLKPLVDRGAMLNFDGAPEFGVTSWRPGVGYPWVSLLDFPSADLPKDVAMGSGGGNLDFDLMLASTRGQVSSAGRAALEGQGTSVTVTEISSASEVAALVFPDRSKSTSHDAPFELAHYGCSWFSRPTIHAETAVVVVGTIRGTSRSRTPSAG